MNPRIFVLFRGKETWTERENKNTDRSRTLPGKQSYITKRKTLIESGSVFFFFFSSAYLANGKRNKIKEQEHIVRRSLFFLPSAKRSEVLQGVSLADQSGRRRRMDPTAKANKLLG